MNNLCQHESLLIGSVEDILALEKKSSAKLLVLSDTHGESEIVEAIIKDFGMEADALMFCGDGCHDIISVLDASKQDEPLHACVPPVVALVRGNGDAETYAFSSQSEEVAHTELVQIPERQMIKVASRTILLVHGHRHSVDLGVETLSASANAMDADLVFYGHTHKAHFEESEASLILNPGSCALPRGGTKPSFALVTFPGVTERYSVQYYSIECSLFGNYTFEEYDILSR